MADISKCSNTKCKTRATCYRATAPDGMWQSYSEFKVNKDGTCDYYVSGGVEAGNCEKGISPKDNSSCCLEHADEDNIRRRKRG